MNGLMMSVFVGIGLLLATQIFSELLSETLKHSLADEDDEIDILIDEIIDDTIADVTMDIRNGYKQNMRFVPPSHSKKKRATACPNCGAPVYGEFCEYCDYYV